MNITANNVVSKLFVGFVATAMLFMLAAPAKAQTAEELQAQINALMAQIAALQGATTPSATCTFTRSLTVGSQGEDVKCLQNALTPTYFNNAGGATGYFGPITAAAVAAWQSANGVMPAVGYFGPISQAKFAMVAAPTTPTTPTTPGDDDSDNTDDSSVSLSGEASLDKMEIDSASDDEVEEGAEDVEIAVATIEFVDGDAMITRLDVTLDGAADVWDVLDEVALFVDGDEIARMSASDEDDYRDTTGSEGTLRFSGLDLVAMEDEEVEVSIVASIQGNVDTLDLGAYTVSVDSLRFTDADDVVDTISSGDDFGIAVGFTLVEAGADDELIVKTSSSDPDGTTLEVEDNAKSDWYNVFTFDLDTDDSVNDIELTTVYVTVTTAGTSSAATFDKLVDDVELVIDGVTIDTLADANGATPGNYTDGLVTVLAFDVDGDVTIDAGDRVAAELNIRFKSLNALDEGATVKGEVTSANANAFEAEGADDLQATTPDQLRGAAVGDVHTLRTAGVNVEAGAITAVVTTADGVTNDYATYKIELDVTAFNQDVYISTSPATAITAVVEDGAGVAETAAGTPTYTLSSTGSQVGSAFEITEGSTETITIEVTFVAGTVSTAARLNLNTLVFGSTSGTPTGQTWTASPDEDYRTAVVTIVN